MRVSNCDSIPFIPIGMVSSKKGQSVNGKSGLHKAEAVQGKVRKDQFQSKCILFSFAWLMVVANGNVFLKYLV